MAWKDDIKYHTGMIRLYLDDIERGHDTTGNISYHILKIQDILIIIPEEEKTPAKKFVKGEKK